MASAPWPFHRLRPNKAVWVAPVMPGTTASSDGRPAVDPSADPGVDGANRLASYGWSTTQEPHTCAFLTPEVLAILASSGARRVLDLGCGNGALCAALSEAGYAVVGLEVDAQAVAIARQAYPHIRFHCLGVESSPQALLQEEEPFDAVVSTEVIEHLYSPHLLPRFAAAVLKPGGLLVISTPYHDYWKNLALSLTNGWDKHLTALWHGGHIKFWSRATLTTLLSQAGFRVTGFRGVGRLPFLWMCMIVVAQKRA